MLDVNLRVRTRDGRVEPLSTENAVGRLGIRHITDELHTSARRLRVFVAKPVTIDLGSLLTLVERDERDLATQFD